MQHVNYTDARQHLADLMQQLMMIVRQSWLRVRVLKAW